MNLVVSVRIINSPAACISGTGSEEHKNMPAAVKKTLTVTICIEAEAKLSNGKTECLFQMIDLVKRRKNSPDPAVNSAIINCTC